MITKDDVVFTTNGGIICKGVKLDIRVDSMHDFQSQTGMDGIILIEWVYNNSLAVLRDKKLEELLS